MALVARREDEPVEHMKLKNELLYLVQKQRARIDKLKAESQVQLVRYSTSRRKELQQKRDDLRRSLQRLQPELGDVRREWQRRKILDTESEAEHQKLSNQYLATSARLKVLQEAIAGASQGTGEGRQSVTATRERLAEVQKDKSDLRAKIKRAIDCLVIDENMLQSRLEEEKAYQAQMQEMANAVGAEVSGFDRPDVKKANLEEEARAIEGQLIEMKQRTNDLHDSYSESRLRRRDMADDFLLEAGRSMQELTHNQILLELKTQVAQELESKVRYLREQFQQQGLGGNAEPPIKEIWLQSKLEVVEETLSELNTLRERYRVRGEDTGLLRETTDHCNRAKAELTTIEQRVEGHDRYRRKLIDEVVDMRFLLNTKLEEEDRLVLQLEQLLVRLLEDVDHVREVVDKPGFDDYVSDDSANEFDEEFVVLDEEGTGDVDAITTSLDFHADDPAGAEAVQRFGHRQQGPLRAFAEARSAQLAKRRQPRLGERVRPRGAESTLEAALARIQELAVGEVVGVILNKKAAMANGTYDARLDAIIPDPYQSTRNTEVQRRVEEWKAKQRQNVRPALGGGELDKNDDRGALSSQEEIAVQYLQRMVTGFTANMFFSGPQGPHPRVIFLTKDLRRLAWRIPQRDGSPLEDESVAVDQLKTVIAGHKTGVFKQHREAKLVKLRPNAALSLITHQQTSLDLEFDTEEERDYWHQILLTVTAELKPGGIISAIAASGAVKVLDDSAPAQRSSIDEPFDRSQVRVVTHTALQ
eukprot:TRINITY_DN27961_c0_g1_i1.p1 TRINITY_DN27961_c0_g1~~TRINITY_DN27961_c0_g1_i1.p1  ORF type:complete len:758 (+),score=379.37 TRINITY_DN27961_c0_g1_i1:59-2332(+)